MNFKIFILSLALFSSYWNIISTESPKENKVQQKVDQKEVTYFDDEFIRLAQQGYVKGVPVKVGTPINIIKDKYGNPQRVKEGEGSYILDYEEVGFHYDASDYDNKKSPVTAIEFVIHDTLVSEMISQLGKPKYSGVSELTGLYTVLYDFNSYELWVEATNDNFIRTIKLKQKL